VQTALKKVNEVILHRHLHSCVLKDVHQPKSQKKFVEEIVELFGKKSRLMKNTKILLGIIIGFIVLLVGGVALLGRKENETSQNITASEVLGLEINPEQTALVIINFDPAAHEPQGVGFFDRIVLLTFSNPAGIKESKFN
jgi:hypothetical protein